MFERKLALVAAPGRFVLRTRGTLFSDKNVATNGKRTNNVRAEARVGGGPWPPGVRLVASLSPIWVSSAREQLLALRHPNGGWGYRAESSMCVEPTVLGCLALASCDGSVPTETTKQILAHDSRLISRLQQNDGAVGVSADIPRPQWPTAMAALLWRNTGGHKSAVARSLQWLLRRQGNSFPKPPNSALGHDTSIPGWPWVAGTHPWLEPTAMAVLALSGLGHSSHDRVVSGVRLILDRSIASGGWNVGNSAVFGRPLRPHPAPTGLALLALKAAGQPANRTVIKACGYLERALAGTRSPESLCWSILGWTVWRGHLDLAVEWLQESFYSSPTLHSSPTRLAYLLLAAHATAATSCLGFQVSGAKEDLMATRVRAEMVGTENAGT